MNVEAHACVQGPVHAQGISEKALISLTDDESLHKLKMKTRQSCKLPGQMQAVPNRYIRHLGQDWGTTLFKELRKPLYDLQMTIKIMETLLTTQCK